NTDGTEKDVLKTEATITAVDPEVISLANTKYTVAKTVDWTKAANTKIAVGEDNFYVFFQLKDSKDKDVTKNYTKVESSDTNTLLVSYKETGKASLIPVKEGTAYVLVKDAKDNVVASLAITVVAKKDAAVMEFTPSSLAASNAFADTVATKVTVKDQYGEKMADPANATVTFDLKSTPTTEKDKQPEIKYENGKISVTTKEGVTVKGTYVYEVKYLKLVRMLTVTVQEADKNLASTYKVALDATKVDTTITTDYDGKDIEINLQVGEYKGNVKVANKNIDKIEVFNAKGEAVTSAAINGSKIIAAKNNANTVEKYLEAGSYSAKVTFKDAANKDLTITTGFVVEDAQPGVTYEVKKNSVDEADIKEAVKNTKNVEFSYNGEKIDGSNVTYLEAKNIAGTKTYAGIKVKVMIPVKVSNDTTYKVPVTITLNQTITVK
ncbi:MAG: hypothetical protein ACOCNB_08910, partial [Acetivibrio ethanolgignens]